MRKPVTLSEQLRREIKEIKKSGISQLQIAKATGVSQPVINRFVREERYGISLDAFERLAAYLKLSLTKK